MHSSPDMATGVLGLLADHDFSEFVVSEADQECQNLDELRRDVAVFEDWQTQYSLLAD